MIEFIAYPKTPRLYRDVTITEKIDGTNAAIQIVRWFDSSDLRKDESVYGSSAGLYRVVAQSRNRVITPQDDNFGFARWVQENSLGLFKALGEGVHFGEWWGSGIQRGYGLPKGERRFSLFNTTRWDPVDLTGVDGLHVVPVLYEGPFADRHVEGTINLLKVFGSHASPRFPRPEGVVLFHHASNSVYKVLCESDEVPKTLLK